MGTCSSTFNKSKAKQPITIQRAGTKSKFLVIPDSLKNIYQSTAFEWRRIYFWDGNLENHTHNNHEHNFTFESLTKYLIEFSIDSIFPI